MSINIGNYHQLSNNNELGTYQGYNSATEKFVVLTPDAKKGIQPNDQKIGKSVDRLFERLGNLISLCFFRCTNREE